MIFAFKGFFFKSVDILVNSVDDDQPGFSLFV